MNTPTRGSVSDDNNASGIPDRSHGALAPVAQAVGRRAAATVLTPVGEQVASRIGYKRIAIAASVAIATVVIVILLTVTIMANIITSIPSTISDALLGNGGDIHAAASASRSPAEAKDLDELVRQCTANTPESTPTPRRTNPATTTPAARPSTTESLRPIPLGRNGEVTGTADRQRLNSPIPAETTAATAHVWFLYILTGHPSQWSEFIDRYRRANGTHPTTEAEPEDTLNAIAAAREEDVIVTNQIRTAAAALTLKAITDKRVQPPSNADIEQLAHQVAAGCFGSSAVPKSRPDR